MIRHVSRQMITLFIFVVVASIVAYGQSELSRNQLSLNPRDTWEGAQLVWSSGSERRLVVVTADEPDRRKACRVQSFDANKLVCKRAFGGPRTYNLQQVVALILPGDFRARIPVWLGLNAGLGAAIWGTVVLTAACPACAVGTGIAALICFSFAGAIVYSDDQPDRLLYRAPEHQLSRRLGDVQRITPLPAHCRVGERGTGALPGCSEKLSH
jgi:hypothetical protein